MPTPRPDSRPEPTFRLVVDPETGKRALLPLAGGRPWPPPPTRSAPWHQRRLPSGEDSLGFRRREEHTVREVRLWGRVVLLNEAEDAVWCPHCLRWVTLVELRSMPYSSHQAIDPRRRGGLFETRYVEEPDADPIVVRGGALDG